MTDILKDRNYYRLLDDAALIQHGRESDDHLAQILVEKWISAKHAYADDHAAEVRAFDDEITDLERQNDALRAEIESLESQLAEKEEY